MQYAPFPPQSKNEDHDVVRLVLSEAKRLHRSATSESLANSLPILRRLIASGALAAMSLPELRRKKQSVQRKHILRMLAIEAGYANWETYRPALSKLSVDEVQHFDIVRRKAGYPNPWFSSLAEAQTFRDRHGGVVLPVGRQAVVLTEASGES